MTEKFIFEDFGNEDFGNGVDYIRIRAEDFQIARIQELAWSLTNALSNIYIFMDEPESDELLVEALKYIKDSIASLYIIDGKLELNGIHAL